MKEHFESKKDHESKGEKGLWTRARKIQIKGAVSRKMKA
jgi:hypothetical protein